MKLLTASKPSELPGDALLARLRCRRAGINLVVVGKSDASSPDPVGWVYDRLNRSLRRRLRPFLDLLAMRNLVLALRYTLVGEIPAAALLNDSLLNEPLKQLLATGQEPEDVISQLEAALVADYPFATGLLKTYRAQGPGGVEQQLASGILQHSLTGVGNPLLEKTLRYLVDMRNLLIINKLWRWQVRQLPPLTAGGQLDPPSLQRLWAAHDNERFTRLVVQRTGLTRAALSATRLEQQLLRGLTRLLRRAGRDPLGVAVIIEYLWLAQLAIHNRILRQVLARDREELLEEVLLI